MTGLTAPASAAQGATVAVSATVQNLGGSVETFGVALADAPPSGGTAGTITPAIQTVTLNAGAATTVSFSWNTTGTSGGTHTLTAGAGAVAVKTNTANNTKSVAVAEQSGVHIGDLDGTRSSVNKNFWRGKVTITAHDAAHAPVANATVAGTWSGGSAATASCTTGSTGTCEVVSGTISVNASSVTFTVTGVSHATLAYNPGANHDPDG